MRNLCRSFPLVALIGALFFTSSLFTLGDPLKAQAPPAYGVNDLGALLMPMAIPIVGFPALAGSFQTPPGTESHGFVGAVGNFVPLGTLGGPSTVARAINVRGTSAGQSQVSSGAYHAFVAGFRSQLTDIGTLGGSESWAYGINDSDVVVGGSGVTGDTGVKKAFIYRNGAISPLGATLGGEASFAFDINNNDQVVGYADLPGTPGSSRAFLFANGATVNLGSLGGRSVAYAINDAGVVVGDSALSGSSPLHAFRWESGVMRDLGTLGGANSSAAAISDTTGTVAGWAENAQGQKHAVIWRDGAIIDLNTLILQGTGWELVAATGIGFDDAVIGYGRRADGLLHGFMLTPPFDVELSLSIHQNEEATNFPNPHEVGGLLLGVSVFNHGDFAPTNLTIKDSITGPIEYVSWTGGDCVVDRTVVGHQTLTCAVTPFESFGRDIMIQTRSTAPGTITHSAEIISGGYVDSDPANDRQSETNTAVALSSLTLANTTVIGGTQVFTVVTLTSPAPVGDARVTLTSSNPAVATVPPFLDVHPWQNGGLFKEGYVTTKPVSAPVTVTISASYGMRTITKSLTVMPAGSSWPFRDTRRTIPGIIQAEDFDEGGEGGGYHDTTRGNDGGKYRTTDVDIESTTDSGGGFDVGWISAGEWLAYSVNVQASGTYRLVLRVAANGAGGRVHVEFDGTNKTGTMTIPNTGGWQTWRDISATVTLAAGAQRMRVFVDGAGATGVVGNLNYITLTAAAAAPDVVIDASDVPSDRIHGSWSKQSDSTSPGGIKLQTTDLGVSNTASPLAAPVDYFDATFTAIAGQQYTLWLRLKALGNNKFNDAVWVQFSGASANGGTIYSIGSTSGLLVNLATDSTAASLSNWGWMHGAYWLMQTTTFTFPAGGTQTIRVQVREDGVQLDQIVLSPNIYRTNSPGAVSNDTVIVPKPR